MTAPLYPDLYRAQTAAANAVQTYCFEPHRSTHISTCIFTCVKAVEWVVGSVIYLIQQVAGAIFDALNWVFPCIGNTLYPINPINGKRHLVLLPRVVERRLGNWIYELITFGMPETSRVYEGNTSIKRTVKEQFDKIQNANREILGVKRDGFSEGYDYRLKVIRSTTVNAFACAGGGMVVFTEIIEEIRDAIKSDKHDNNQIFDIHFADGSVAKVDLSSVTADDVIAALLSHEMTHVASRHTLSQLALALVLTLVLNVVRALIVGGFGEESSIHQFLLQLQDMIMQYLLNYRSRQHEYESDVTSIELMRNAGCNPLGAIYLQEILTRMHRNGALDWLHSNFEFLFTHPYGERRKRALFAAISVLAPEKLRGASLTLKPTDLDRQRASPGIRFAESVKRDLHLADHPI